MFLGASLWAECVFTGEPAYVGTPRCLNAYFKSLRRLDACFQHQTSWAAPTIGPTAVHFKINIPMAARMSAVRENDILLENSDDNLCLVEDQVERNYKRRLLSDRRT